MVYNCVLGVDSTVQLQLGCVDVSSHPFHEQCYVQTCQSYYFYFQRNNNTGLVLCICEAVLQCDVVVFKA